MSSKAETVVDKTFTTTYVVDDSILSPTKMQAVVPQYPLVHGDFLRLKSHDDSNFWSTNFKIALFTSLLNLIGKSLASQKFNDHINVPGTWEYLICIICAIGLWVSSYKGKNKETPRSKLVKKIEEILGE